MSKLKMLIAAFVLAVAMLGVSAVPASAGDESRSLACNHSTNQWFAGGAWYRSYIRGWNNVYVGGGVYHYHHRDHYVWNGRYWAWMHQHNWIWCGNAIH